MASPPLGPGDTWSPSYASGRGQEDGIVVISDDDGAEVELGSDSLKNLVFCRDGK